MTRQEAFRFGASYVEVPVKAEAVSHRLSATSVHLNDAPEAEKWRMLCHKLDKEVTHASTMEAIFRSILQALLDILPCDAASLVIRTADAKFVRTQLIAFHGQILEPTKVASMPLRRFSRLLGLPSAQDYLTYLPARFPQLLFPDWSQSTTTPAFPSVMLVPLRDLPALSVDGTNPPKTSHLSAGQQSTPSRTLLSADEGSKKITTEQKQIGGCLAIVSEQAHAFSRPHGDLLVELAGLLADGIHRVQLLQEKRRTIQGLQALAEASVEMQASLDWDTALQKIAQAAVRVLSIPIASVACVEQSTVGNTEQSIIFTGTNEKGAVAVQPHIISSEPARCTGNTELQIAGLAASEWPTFPLRKTRGLLNRLLRNRSITVNDIPKSRILTDTARTTMARHDIRFYHGLPILLRQCDGLETAATLKPFILLSLYTHAPHDFDDLERMLLHALAAQVPMVLDNLQRHREVQKSKERLEGFLSIDTTTSPRRVDELEIQRRSEDLENFVYVISHNLKTPLVSIQGFANILQEELGPALDSGHRHFLERIQKSAASMEKMILDLLEFSRLGHSPFTFEMVNLNELVQSVIEEMRLPGQLHEVEFILPRPPSALPNLYADGDELKTVFENLLNNAVKYRRAGVPLRIEVGCEELPRFHLLWVRDNGMGMDPAFQTKAFDLFQRGPNVGQIQGTGIGLAIVRRIIENHKGLVRIDSQPGEGTTVYFTLPKMEALPPKAFSSPL
ncbi:MAG: HAMP domain-containing histidine kinase [candidate division KSB1 bacterium]|nr:HAMP domain-containing histidine kinase [candidate division KSB1 bacterium]MDZ7304008.1 HAMP domain-containing histidine kinase [candidate division KSB1 bacterium]MDZ7313282.1 HAMP domain-containing histidine kinase [candidate division KSB1 bacterium]